MATSVMAGIKNRNRLNSAGKLILILIAFLLVSELLAEVLGRNRKNNMVVYHIACPIELLLVCSYFRRIIIRDVAKKATVWLGLVGVVLSMTNTILLQPLDTINSNFLLFESCVIIGLSIFAFYEMMVREDYDTYQKVHFWFTSILIFLWSGVFFYWGIYTILIANLRAHFFNLTYLFWVVNLFAYTGFAVIFLLYKKLIGDHPQ
jgi:hypothetical protein